MTIATLFVALIATSAADTPGDPVLLDFQATWCGPCREMRPVVAKLVQNGYPVKEVDIDRSPELSDRYRVRAVPTFIVVDSRGKELARTKGVMTALQLATFYNEAKLKGAAQAGPVEEAQDRGNLDDVPAAESSPTDSNAPTPLVNPKPWETVVRIKMHLSNTEWGFGSGTIIYSSAEESIILTCAHIFRVKGPRQPEPRNFQVPIAVDLFDGQFVTRQPATLSCSQKDLPGEAIDYDFTNDVGLIRIRPGRKLAASQVVPPWWHPKKGMKMYTVGCSHGQDATAWDTTILDPRIPMSNTETKQSFTTIKCAHQPKEGRSGGGLYTSDGYVAGVCDFADPNEHVGLYAVPEAIHRLLDRNKMTALYKPSSNGTGPLLASQTRSKPATGTRARGQSPEESAGLDPITLPPPNLVGVAVPPWQSKTVDQPASRSNRSTGRPDPAFTDSVDPGARPGEALTAGLNADPGPDARAFEDSETPLPIPAPKRVARSTTPAPSSAPTTSKPQVSGWRRPQVVLPDLAGSRPTPR